jgi:DNA-directed RNA polymerase sigma subunit (sigma70/sigma32)
LEADPLAVYLGQIARYRLLSQAEELELASGSPSNAAPGALRRQLARREDRPAGAWAEKLGGAPQVRLKHRMINANLRLVVAIASTTSTGG